MKKTTLLLLLILVITSSCTFEKRKYNKGYHVESLRIEPVLEKEKKQITKSVSRSDETGAETIPDQNKITNPYNEFPIIAVSYVVNERVINSRTATNLIDQHINKNENRLFRSNYSAAFPSEDAKPEKENEKEGLTAFYFALGALIFSPLSIFAIVHAGRSFRNFRNEPDIYKGFTYPVIAMILGILEILSMLFFIVVAFLFIKGL